MIQYNTGNFNAISRYYDALARVVFRNKIYRSQIEFLDTIATGSKVLIVGGGTGWIIAEVNKRTKSPNICFIEKSDRFIARAVKNAGNVDNVNFIHGSFLNHKFDVQFDVIISNFYLDLYSKEHLRKEIEAIKRILNTGGLWLVSDFQISANYLRKLWQLPLTSIMYRFFNLITGLSTRKLEDIFPLISEQNFQEINSATFYSELICSKVFIQPHQKRES